MTNRSTVDAATGGGGGIHQGASGQRRMEGILCCVCVCVWRRATPPPHISTGNRKGQREKSMSKEHEEQAYKMALTAPHALNKGCPPPNLADHECFISYIYRNWHEKCRFLRNNFAIVAMTPTNIRPMLWHNSRDMRGGQRNIDGHL